MPPLPATSESLPLPATRVAGPRAADERVVAAAAAVEHVAGGVAVDPVVARRADDVLELADQRQRDAGGDRLLLARRSADGAPVEALLRSRVMPLVTPGKTMVLMPSVWLSVCGWSWPKVAEVVEGRR